MVLAAAAVSLILPRVAGAQGASVWPDSNGNRIIEIGELFDVIDYYFSGDTIPEPATPASASKWVQNPITSTSHGFGLVNSAEDGSVFGPWYLSLQCDANGNPGVFLWNVPGWIYSNADTLEFEETALDTTVADSTQADAWYYWPADGFSSDYFGYRFDDALISAMLNADEMTVTIPFATPSTVTFSITGLSEHIDGPSDLCP